MPESMRHKEADCVQIFDIVEDRFFSSFIHLWTKERKFFYVSLTNDFDANFFKLKFCHFIEYLEKLWENTHFSFQFSGECGLLNATDQKS